jgi:acyl-[acyl-carrier-protein]-phospholipid O-acyltransferase/long-chain-fatty-acid--[acyl-carrier-protein] ligase
LFFYGLEVLRLDEMGIGRLTMSLALGIGVGSAAAGYLSGGKIEYGLVPLGALGMSIVSASLALPGGSVTRVMVLIAALGFAGGFFIVPISALLQHRPARCWPRQTCCRSSAFFWRRARISCWRKSRI